MQLSLVACVFQMHTDRILTVNSIFAAPVFVVSGAALVPAGYDVDAALVDCQAVAVR